MGDPAPSEYPNQNLGVDFVTDANNGAVNQVAAPLNLATKAGAAGCTINSGSGTPASNNIPGNVGDLYIRTDGTDATYFYRCTVAGTAGNATWAAITGA